MIQIYKQSTFHLFTTLGTNTTIMFYLETRSISRDLLFSDLSSHG